MGTEDEAEATRLVSQLDELVGDTGLHSLSKRREAERRFDAIVVSAFYEPMEGAVVDDATAICEVRVPLPKNGVPKVLLTGATGSEKHPCCDT